MQELDTTSLEAMSRAVDPDVWAIIDKYPENLISIEKKKNVIEKAKNLISIYRSSSEIIVKTEDEANNLPAGTIIESLDDAYSDFPVLTLQSNGKWYGAWDWEIPIPVVDFLPARIISRTRNY